MNHGRIIASGTTEEILEREGTGERLVVKADMLTILSSRLLIIASSLREEGSRCEDDNVEKAHHYYRG